MHFSSFIVSMMAAGAMAAPHGSWGNSNKHYKVVTEYEYVTHYVTAGDNAPQPTYVPEQVAPVVVKKPKQNPAPQPTYVAAPEPATTQEEAPAATQPSSGSSNLDSDQQKALDLHNEARKAVGNEPLTWDDSLASGAQEWADHLAQLGSLQHSQGKDGENLYMGSGSNPFASAVEAFLSEKSQYNGEAISGSNYMSFGHYTQCVWKTTTKVGMAVAKDSSGASWVVARYQAPGNMIGDKPY
ncbi:PR-1 class pathogen-related protein [Fusarium denticulatum]|uniref:PR-1 class pathogen-related protein n=1 Tax=Fusarium denticulatum TaxID=48507 RepID=A0A8H6CWW8_9HYPO|nr:PR-1 class pathogen-related protein [Fusarium denticulatum]